MFAIVGLNAQSSNEQKLSSETNSLRAEEHTAARTTTEVSRTSAFVAAGNVEISEILVKKELMTDVVRKR